MPTLDANNNIVISVADIRALNREFLDTTRYSDAQIQADIEIAGAFVSTKNYGDIGFKRRALLIELMAAHLLKLDDMMAGAPVSSGGAVSGSGDTRQKSNATVGQVSVGYAIPKNDSELSYWLNETEYGRRYLALLKLLCTPLYFGGSPQRVLR